MRERAVPTEATPSQHEKAIYQMETNDHPDCAQKEPDPWPIPNKHEGLRVGMMPRRSLEIGDVGRQRGSVDDLHVCGR